MVSCAFNTANLSLFVDKPEPPNNKKFVYADAVPANVNPLTETLEKVDVI